MRTDYPRIAISSKNQLVKRISSKASPRAASLILVNDVLKNFDKYWKDNIRHSEPTKDKYVRSARNTPLGRLLDKINRLVLAPYDKMLPTFIFGGVADSDHVKAAASLLGRKRKRTLLKVDIKRFFEHVPERRVVQFFAEMARCGSKGAKLLAALSCVPEGPKGGGSGSKTIARGFATSSRLAVWCNISIFRKVEQLVQLRLRGRDPRIAIYVDDIGISATRTSKEEMWRLVDEIERVLREADPDQPLELNKNKTEVIHHTEGLKHLGLRLERNSLSLGTKTRVKMLKLRTTLTEQRPAQEKRRLKQRLRGLMSYKRYVDRQKSS